MMVMMVVEVLVVGLFVFPTSALVVMMMGGREV